MKLNKNKEKIMPEKQSDTTTLVFQITTNRLTFRDRNFMKKEKKIDGIRNV